MLRDITLGQYYPVASVLHRLDPRTKLFGTMVFIISLFVADSIWAYLAATVFLAAAIKISHVPFRFMVRGLKAIIFLLLISVSFNLFLTQGEVLFQLWFLKVTDGLEKSLGFLKKIGLPVHEVSMMMSIALRFIPILVEETDKIMKAQMARGADFESGNIIQRAKNMIPLLVPLFISAFRRATDLAMAMEARCYRGGEGRTKMKPLHYAKRDGVTYLVYIAYLAVIIVLRILI